MTENHVSFGEQWKLLKWGLLRSAGFRATTLHALEAPTLIELIDELNVARSKFSAVRDQAIEEIETLEPTKKTHRAVRALQRNDIAKAVATLGASELFDALIEAECVFRTVVLECEEAYSKHERHQSRVLCEVSADSRLREALVWQNPRALRNCFDWLIRHSGDGSNKERRKKELMVARYLQRYVMKNETIGFFGPVGFFEFVQTPGLSLRLDSQRPWLDQRRVYFEHWCIASVSEALSARESFQWTSAPKIVRGGSNYRCDDALR